MRNVLAFAILWLALIVQSTLFQVQPLRLVQPNLVLVTLCFVALARGVRPALVLGVLIGFIQDFDYGTFVGLYAFAYGLTGYFAAAMFAQFLQRNVALTFLVAIGQTFAFDWVTYGITRLFDMTTSGWRPVLAHSLWDMLVDGICTLLLYPLLTRWFTARGGSRYRTDEEEPAG
ncbi:hypothetical protein GCM10010885_02360 [Alicyclobacillus cellulosilyticus]|uniref:Rod shape-determining protein MreD n=1 Tax=Alicyclobacillus cellulosilyticus TaxID=1003997 RepID=A0A917NF54_9BACL|nr:rod shape-determining protein MreD [Alicyclobacillus cellulosilyticus]GGI96244.1 hypothetical protein GCM10010885_02360 [Alicyclobacillus cellulosilyticus]